MCSNCIRLLFVMIIRLRISSGRLLGVVCERIFGIVLYSMALSADALRDTNYASVRKARGGGQSSRDKASSAMKRGTTERCSPMCAVRRTRWQRQRGQTKQLEERKKAFEPSKWPNEILAILALLPYFLACTAQASTKATLRSHGTSIRLSACVPRCMHI